MARLGIGLIGVGRHGSRYARHIVEDLPEEVRLAGLARRDYALARLQAATWGCRAYADYRELIAAPDVDAVVVVVPPTLHAEIVAAAAAHRRPVLLEKPAATSVADGRRLLHVVHQAGIPVMVAQTLRYNSVVRALLAARPRIGRLHGVRLGQRFEPSRPPWLDEPAVSGGGMILHTGVHCFDLVRLLTSLEVDRVACEMAAVETQRTEDNFSAVLRLGGGAALAAVAGSRATASRSGGIELAGEHGQLIGDHVLGTAYVVHGATPTPLPVAAPAATVCEALRAFAGAVRDGEPPPIPLEEGVRAVAIAEACYRAARAGTTIAVSDLTDDG